MSLRKRKEQQFIKYIFGEGVENLDHLMDHVYQTSIAVVVKDLLGVQTSNYDADFQKEVRKHKIRLMEVLISKLSPELSLETNMSAQITICDLVESRENRDLWGVLV